jgi:hypothetical protein
MPKKGQQKRWFWRCTWERGHGIDLDVCGAESKRGYATREGAEKAGQRHLDNPPSYYSHSTSWGGAEARIHVWSEYR